MVKGRDEKCLTLPVCKINALKVVAPNSLGTANCLNIFAQRRCWKYASRSCEISDSAASQEKEHSFYLERSLQAGLAGGEAEPALAVRLLLLDFVARLNQLSSKLIQVGFIHSNNAEEVALRPVYAKQNIFPARAMSGRHHPVLVKSISSMKRGAD